MKEESLLKIEQLGYKSIKQIVSEVGKQNKQTAINYCVKNHIEPDFIMKHGRGEIWYFSPEKTKLIKQFILQDTNTLKNLTRNHNLHGKSKYELCRIYKVSPKVVKKYNLKTEDDFIDYIEKRNSISPITLCKRYGIRYSTFLSYNPDTEPSENNIKKFAELYKLLSPEEKKRHRAELMSENNRLHPEWQQKAIEAIYKMTPEEKEEQVRKCFVSRSRNGTFGYNGNAKYEFNGKRYNLLELCFQLEHPEWERLNNYFIPYGKGKKYFPDFRDTKTNRIIEIKGRHLIKYDENGDWYLINLQTKLPEIEKTLCLKKNNVCLKIDNNEESKIVRKKWSVIAKQYLKTEIGTYIESVKKKQFSESEKEFFRKKNCIPIVCLQFPDKVFYGYTDAAEKTGVNNTVIKNYLSGKTKHIKQGYVFMYLEDYKNMNQ